MKRLCLSVACVWSFSAVACNKPSGQGSSSEESQSESESESESGETGSDLPEDLSGWSGLWTMTPPEVPVGEPFVENGFANFEVLTISDESVHLETAVCGASFVTLDVEFDLRRDEDAERMYLEPQSTNWLVGEGERFEELWLELGEPCEPFRALGVEDGEEVEWATWHRQALCWEYCDDDGAQVSTMVETCSQDACPP